jgi:hypothetical protein
MLGVSRSTVFRWTKRALNKTIRKERKLKVNIRLQKWIFNYAANKPTHGGGSVGAIKIALKKAFPQYDEAVNIGKTTIKKYLKILLHRPLRYRKIFKVPEDKKRERKEFCEFIIKEGIKGKDMFFTDEKIFQLNSAPNNQLSQVRLSNEKFDEFKTGDKDLNELLGYQQEKFPAQVMVSGGISYYGQGKLIFLIGNIDGQTYRNVLDYYIEDITVNLQKPTLYLQQDNASIHKANNDYLDSKCGNRLKFWPAHVSLLSFFRVQI